MMKNETSDAMRLYNIILKKDKFNPTGMEGMAAALFRSKGPEESAKYLEARIQEAEKEANADARVNASLCKTHLLSAQSRYDEAVLVLQTMVARDPLDFRPHMQLVMLKAKMGEQDQVKAHYEKALELAPEEYKDVVRQTIQAVPETALPQDQAQQLAKHRVEKVKARVAATKAARDALQKEAAAAGKQ